MAAHSGYNSLRDTNKYKSNYKTGGPGGIRPGSSSDLGNGYAISKGKLGTDAANMSVCVRKWLMIFLMGDVKTGPS